MEPQTLKLTVEPRKVGPRRAQKGGAQQGGAPKAGALKDGASWWGRRGSHTTAPDLQTCTFQGTCASKTPPKFNEKDQQQREKRIKIVARGKKKSEILGSPAEGGPAEGGPAEGSPAEGGPAEGGPAEKP